jgi:putative sigma-54 modulation protein
MELLVRNAEGNLKPVDREYAAKKLGRLDKFLNKATKVEMVHREEKHSRHNGHRVEITVFADGLCIRGEEYDTELRAAIDRVSDKLESRLMRFKGRLIDRHRRKGNNVPAALESLPDEEPESSKRVEIREKKQFLLKPMTVDEAALQMEMVDHAFFVFRNEETGRFEVLYKRRDGRYGLLQPEV